MTEEEWIFVEPVPPEAEETKKAVDEEGFENVGVAEPEDGREQGPRWALWNYETNNWDPLPDDWASPDVRYDQLRELAKGVNHKIWVTVAPGALEAGEEKTMVFLTADPSVSPLVESLEKIEEYLKTDTAKRRGDLYAELEERKKEYRKAFVAQLKADSAVRAAEKAIRSDLDSEVDAVAFEPDPEVTEGLAQIED